LLFTSPCCQLAEMGMTPGRRYCDVDRGRQAELPSAFRD